MKKPKVKNLVTLSLIFLYVEYRFSLLGSVQMPAFFLLSGYGLALGYGNIR
jgi:hypothetical protein